MAQQNETIRLVLETIGQSGLQALAQAAEDTKTRLEALKMGYDAGNLSQSEFVKGTEKFTTQLRAQTTLLDKLKGAQEGAGKSSANMGQAMLNRSAPSPSLTPNFEPHSYLADLPPEDRPLDDAAYTDLGFQPFYDQTIGTDFVFTAS